MIKNNFCLILVNNSNCHDLHQALENKYFQAD